MKGFFSIRAKFLGVMSALLVACLVVYLLIAVEVFKTDKTELVFDLNRSMVSNLSTELETEFDGVSDKLRLFALLSNNPAAQFESENVFGENSSVVYASLYRQDQNKSVKNYIDKKYLETYGLDTNFFESTLLSNRPVPFSEILKNGEHFWNASIDGGTPLIGFGRNVIIEDQNGIPSDHLAVISYIKLDKILKVLSFVKLSEISIVDGNGTVLIHPDYNVMKATKTLQHSPLFSAALNSKVNISVASLKDDSGEFLGAYAKAYQGQIFVLARASKNQAFSAVYELVSRSISFALIVITLSLFFAFLLSRSLTRPISILVDGMEKVSGGDLSTQINVTSKDETQILASSFNKMIQDLKQSRDELQEINRELDKKVKERTLQLEIQNQAVKEAQEALLKTTRLASAGEIAGRAAHEVLNPLTGILTRLSAIEKKVQNQIAPQINLMKDIFQSWKDDHHSGGFPALLQAWQQSSQVDSTQTLWDEDMKNLNYVQQSFEDLMKTMEVDTQFLQQESRRISKIIGGMRTLSRLNSDVQTYSVKKLLTDCKNIMADLFIEQHIQIREDYQVDIDDVEIDRDEFIQAVTNLMRNSLQAMPVSHPGSYFLKLSTQLIDGHIHVVISDNGSGISNEHQKLLFEKQFTTKSADEGTGLGLGISRRFIRAHGGDIEFVSSEPFSQTVFRIILPLKSINSTSLTEGAA
ncbi:MAG: hypothetical protein A2622_07230 [Bdellovibrionales bacterium RIFCSPHIGHO2_01_FULL_40_29]|nr:MAG: hypothetical protein A2622_07230 [Bdellovibrionales bacterium RIFCSPHIGHO2_01_FULL_40_29]OFZ33267.1 MAG: hypothetical protein A3D17_12250 [Bdellovibrionales bacterium RIFCSPHIGHO2_02_FULL_40_15]